MPGAAARVTSTAPKKDWPGLAATLADLDDAALARLLTLRPDLTRPPPRDLGALASRTGAWPGARDCYLALDRAGQHVVEALCLAPEPAARSDLAHLLGVAVDDADLASALVRLEERALAFTISGGVGPDVHIRLLPALRQIDYPARLGPPVASILGRLGGPALEQTAHRVGVTPARTKPETLDLIVALVSDPKEVEGLLQRGPAGTIDLARRVAGNGPLVTVQHGLYGIGDHTPAGWMVNRGLLSVVDYYTAVMPREPAVALRGGVFPRACLRRPRLERTDVDAGGVDRAAAERASGVVADLVAILDQWSSDPPSVLKAGGVGVREIRKAAKLVERPDTEAARLVELAGVAGLARADPLAGEVLPTDAYDEWLALEVPDRWVALAAAWRDAELHLSLAGAISTKEKPIPPLLVRGAERDALHRRRQVTSVLADAAPGQATDPAGLRRRVEWDSPAAWAGGPATPPTLIAWVLEECDLLGVGAAGALSTAGRAVLRGDAEGAAAALAAIVPPAVAEFVIQADLTAVIAGRPAAAIRSELDLLADVESKGAATVYRFTEASVRRAFDAGRTADGILEFLERHATRGVPQPLAYLVADVGRRFGNVRIGAAASYLRSDDPALLAEVLQARATSRLRLRSIAPTVLVADADPATVASTLQAAGYLPAREAADGALLLARPPARRAPSRAFPARRPVIEPDPSAIVADLRPVPIPPPAPPAPATWPEPTFGATPRPTEIARGPRAVRALLGLACEECWVVRLSYAHSNAHASELNVEPMDIDARGLYAHCIPDGDERRFVVERIEWARVLTEVEEDLL